MKNFRIHQDVAISLEDKTTVIVGRNNTGKTCLTELFRRILSESSPKFSLEDFSLSVHERFWEAFQAYNNNDTEEEIRVTLPVIEVVFTFTYDPKEELGLLTDFIIDLDVTSTNAIAVVKYQLKNGAILDLFKDLNCTKEKEIGRQQKLFYREIRERIPSYYVTSIMAQDPTDPLNQKFMELGQLRSLIQPDFINAQRGLDDSTIKERDILGKVLERLLVAASADDADESDQTVVVELEDAVRNIQEKLDGDFNVKLNSLLPTLSMFGYPGLGDPNLQTETILDVRRLLGNNTRIRYTSATGINLPETYNGLGSRNLIYILLQLHEFFKTYKAKQPAPGMHIIFIEEPEAHLHPQMQEVFVRKVHEIAETFAKQLGEGNIWPVQLVITTHSTHIANEAPFESIRYFLSKKNNGIPQTFIKDLRQGVSANGWGTDKEFLHKYLTLTRCDLFFADKAIMIEGATERILMPKMIEKVDSTLSGSKLKEQYITTIEVGGAYAHKFFGLLAFLELNCLIITDIDSVDAKNTKSLVSSGVKTSNACIKEWFENKQTSPVELLKRTTDHKVKGHNRLAYQIPEDATNPCGRSFEEAFMLSNPTLFNIQGKNVSEKEIDAFTKSSGIDKTDFAIEYAINTTNWKVPLYITEGLLWLAQTSSTTLSAVSPVASGIKNTSLPINDGEKK